MADNQQQSDGPLNAQVISELREARDFAKSLNLDDVKKGDWFLLLLQKVIQTCDRNARAKYFMDKYPGLPPDDVADMLISVVAKYATIAGAVTGTVATTAQIATLASAGLTAPLLVGSIGAELLYLARIQMRLVLDLAAIYDLQLDTNDPKEILTIFQYALGIKSAGLVGKGLQKVAGSATKKAVRTVISKGTLKAVQRLARQLGFKMLQRTILKYSVPIVSTAIGASYNYVTTMSFGRIAKTDMKNRGKVTDELQALISRQQKYDLAFPGAALYLAHSDGVFSEKEKELYRGMLTRMPIDEHARTELQKMLANEETLIARITQIEDVEMRRHLVEVLVLMATYDGDLSSQEHEFLANIAARLGVSINLDDVVRRSQGYRVAIETSALERIAQVSSNAASAAIDTAGQALVSAKNTAVDVGGTVKDIIRRAIERKTSRETETPSGAILPTDPTETLRKLKELLNSGLIEQADYDAKKAEILSTL